MPNHVKFYKAPRYLFRKLNVLSLLDKQLTVKSFLDVGCGAGELACTLAERGMTGTAIDFSAEAIAVAEKIRVSRHIKKSSLRFKLGGFESVPGKKYDLVSCYEVLEHVEDDKKFLDELVSHSKKYVLISVPAKQKLYDSSDESVGHFRRYEKQTLIKMLEESNLDIIEFTNYGYPFTNIVRLARKVVFSIRLRNKKSESMENRSKDSGINPIKMPRFLENIDIEKLVIPFYLISRIFNSYDLSEGYLVLCRVRD